MPPRTPKACRVRGCRNTTTDPSGYCESHKSEGWKQYKPGQSRHQRGYPYQMNQDESVRLLAHVVSKYIVRLAKVPQSSVDQMSPADLNAAAWLVAGFFLQA